MKTNNYDFIIIGTGPAGATLARELSAVGSQILVLEKGSHHAFNGGPLSSLPMIDLKFMGNKTSLIRGITTGGSSMLYFATAYQPPSSYFHDLEISLESEITWAQQELPVAPLADELIGPKARLIANQAKDLGLNWGWLPKMIHQEQCAPEYHPLTARWSAREFLHEAQAQGAIVETDADVHHLLQKDESFEVHYRQHGKSQIAKGAQVLLAAGGIGSPAILQRSGIVTSPASFFCDPLVIVSGEIDGKDRFDEFSMTGGCQSVEGGYMLTDISLPMVAQIMMSGQKLALNQMLSSALQLFRPRQTVSLMVKIRDEIDGSIDRHENLNRTFSAGDQQKLADGVALAKRILTGIKADNQFVSEITSAHPGGSLPIGRDVDRNLQSTQVENLYVCDCSVLPYDWGVPPSLTIISLAKRLASQLIGTKEKKPKVAHAKNH